ncbi:ArnT family glycosyltransferase, partial [uncultured Muribaculum sp.]
MLPVVHINSRNAFWFVALIVIATLLPFLGETMFNSKGEPREAIVAVSMLNSGDWILPVSNGDVIPYKPPFMAWCIALFSLLAGHVTEYTSRLPSALALIVLVLWSYRFFA